MKETGKHLPRNKWQTNQADFRRESQIGVEDNCGNAPDVSNHIPSDEFAVRFALLYFVSGQRCTDYSACGL